MRSVWTQHRYDWVGLPEGIEHFAQGSMLPKKLRQPDYPVLRAAWRRTALFMRSLASGTFA
jgi:hypothetical protein